jgi:hypothetical protein
MIVCVYLSVMYKSVMYSRVEVFSGSVRCFLILYAHITWLLSSSK